MPLVVAIRSVLALSAARVIDLIARDPTGAPLTDNGFARLVVPGDACRGRVAADRVSLEVSSVRAVPEPSAALLLLARLIAALATRFPRALRASPRC
jgi:hypothetical protein